MKIMLLGQLLIPKLEYYQETRLYGTSTMMSALSGGFHFP